MPLDALEDPRRIDPPLTAGEREMLEAWLEFHRVTLLLKCEGLSDDDRKRRPVETSLLSLHGLIRHMADVEWNWFVRVLAERTDATPNFWRHPGSEADLEDVADAVWEDDLAAWTKQCTVSREVASARELDDTGCPPWGGGERVSLRWIYVHMIEEYARHNGHADLIREMIDGAVGD